ncbi:hypothetical protein A3F38_01395 [Candidatus Saccharibacteria bacterium RIFCSPHIGHO2_12_FULL_48_21]|nr:MAG: hypothetical protein A3F38_01395 [Candidatus Saccharibacteria bacterium RIFCSPHIGHO2_12_FULL_48_21]
MVKGESSGSSNGSRARIKRLTKKERKQKGKLEVRSRSKLSGSFSLAWKSAKTIRTYWKPLFGIMLVYLILNVVFASGVSNLSSVVSDIKFNLEASDSENLNPLGTALGGFSNLVASAGTSGSATGSTLQTTLIIIVSLVIIWSLRSLLAGKTIKVKQAYYSSMFPLIPFLLVLLVLFIQWLPVLLGVPIASAILSAIFVSGGVFATTLLVMISIALLGWSLYMISSSLFAIYIVTLPDMQPRKALRSAKDLVAFRRWTIMRRLIVLPIVMLVAMAVVVIPLILYLTFLVTPVFLVLSVLSVLFIHTYLYLLYRELIT